MSRVQQPQYLSEDGSSVNSTPVVETGAKMSRQSQPTPGLGMADARSKCATDCAVERTDKCAGSAGGSDGAGDCTEYAANVIGLVLLVVRLKVCDAVASADNVSQ